MFEQHGIEVPSTWSQTATNIVASKYFRGQIGSPDREDSVRGLISRVADTIRSWAEAQGYFASAEDLQAFSDELTHLLVHQKMAFNSPVWFNVGIEKHPQSSACFINSVQDTMESILGLARTEGMLFKFGSGTGSNLSSIRSSKEPLAGGGTASGPVSFMRGYDAFAGVIKSGGKTRRAAKMVILNTDHPDIVEFVNCKAEEERKAWALIDAGYDGSFNVRGGAYDSVFFQNANHSVRVTDEFMRAVVEDREWETKYVLSGEPCERFRARDLMNQMAEAAWQCGDPGIQYDTTVNDWHTCPNTARINGSNPCSEYMFLDDTACNLASLNLMKFVGEDGEFDTEAFRAAARTTITAQEILVDNSSYPTPAIDRNSHEYRPLGLGYANLGVLLMDRGLPYDSDAGRAYAAAVTALMHGEAYAQSARVASAMGPFAGYAKNAEPMLRVIDKHRKHAHMVDSTLVPKPLLDAALDVWDEAYALGAQHGYRNSQVTVLAPTGTIGFMMDCDTTGIEPDIALVKYKKLVGGGVMKIVNQSVARVLRKLGYTPIEVEDILRHIDEKEMIEGAPHLKDEHLAIFDCAFPPRDGKRSIHWMGHIKMMAAVQPFLSGAISKTVNMPTDATPEDIQQAYVEGWKLGLKAIAVYRDGCKRSQPLSTSKHEAKATEETPAAAVATAGAAGRRGPARPPQAARRAPRDHPQVLDRRPRGLHHGRDVRGRQARRDLPGDGEGGLDDLGPHGRVRDVDLDGAAVRRAARGPRREVLARALRAVGLHEELRDPVREEHHRLHLPVARLEVPLGRAPGGGGRAGDGPVAEAALGSGDGGGGPGRPRRGRGRGIGGGRGRGDARAERRAAVPLLRQHHDPQRLLLPLRELRLHERLQLGTERASPRTPGAIQPRGRPAGGSQPLVARRRPSRVRTSASAGAAASSQLRPSSGPRANTAVASASASIAARARIVTLAIASGERPVAGTTVWWYRRSTSWKRT